MRPAFGGGDLFGCRWCQPYKLPAVTRIGSDGGGEEATSVRELGDHSGVMDRYVVEPPYVVAVDHDDSGGTGHPPAGLVGPVTPLKDDDPSDVLAKV